MLISHTRDVLINRLIMPVAAFLLLIAIARKSDVLLGEYALVTTFFFVMQTLPMLGLGPFVMREVARKPEDAGRYLVTVGSLALLAGLLIAFSTRFWLAYSPYSLEVRQGIRVAAFAILPGVLAFLAEMTLISLHWARAAAVTAVVENLLRLTASVYCIHLGYSVAALMWVLVVTRSLALCAYAIELTIGGQLNLLQKPDVELLRKVGRVLPTFFLYTICALVISRLDYLVLSVYQSATELGYYAVAYRMLEIAMLATIAVLTAIFPKLSLAYAKDPADFVQALCALFPVGLAMFCGVAMVGIGFAETYVFLLFHRQYPHPVVLTQLFMGVIVLAAVDGMISNGLQAADRQRFDLFGLMSGGAVYAVALFLLVPPLHSMGAFLSLVAATLVQMSVRILSFERTLGKIIDWARVTTILLAAGITLGPVLWTIHSLGVWGGPIVLLLTLTLYPLLLFATGGCGLAQALGQFWIPAEIRPPGTLVGVIDHIAEDARAWLKYQNRHIPKDTIRYENFGLLCAIFLRWSRWAYLTGHPVLERLLRRFALATVKSDILASADVGPGIVLRHPAGTVIAGRVGRDAIFGPLAGIYPAGVCNAGAGPGIPVLGDGVELAARVVIIGGVRINDHRVLGPHTVIHQSGMSAEVPPP